MARLHLYYEQCQYNLVHRYRQRLSTLYSYLILRDDCEMSTVHSVRISMASLLKN
jgi:hypothetical protein